MKKLLKYAFSTLLGILFSIPVITLADSITAMHFVNFKLVDDENTKVFPEFMKSFKLNFKQSLAFLVFILSVGGVLSWIWVGVFKDFPDVNYILGGLVLIATLLFFNFELMSTYLLSKFENSTKRLFFITIYASVQRVNVMTKLALLETVVFSVPAVIICVNKDVVSCILGAVVFYVLLLILEMRSAININPIFEMLLRQDTPEEAVEEESQNKDESIEE